METSNSALVGNSPAENQGVNDPLPVRTAAGFAYCSSPSDHIMRGICEAAELPLARAHTIPAGAYTDPDFYKWEVEHLLRGGWQCLAHQSQIPQPGDFLNIDLLGEPLIVVHGKEGSVRVLSRVCPHRAMDIMPDGFGYDGHGPAEARPGEVGCGHTRLFLCPYHAWTYELDGKLKACPEMHEAEEFVRDDYFLKPFRTEMWQGFVFVNLDEKADPLAESLQEMEKDVAPWRLAEMRLVVAKEWECEFNWKVLVENFMESYHHLGIHHKTLQPMMPARDSWTEQERKHYVRAHLPYKPSVRENLRAAEAAGDVSNTFPPVVGLDELRNSEWGLFLIHPTFLLATAQDRVIWYRIQPLGPDRIKLLTTTLVAPEITERPDFEELRQRGAESLYAFHLEDMQVCTAVQRGLRSTGWRSGRLSHLEMPVWLFYRFLAARIQGIWPTEDGHAAEGQRRI